MIIFREQQHRVDAATMLGALMSTADRLATPAVPPHDDVVACLIEAGVLEAAVADALCPEVDHLDPITIALRQASIATGHLLLHSWRRTWDTAAPTLARLRRGLDA